MPQLPTTYPCLAEGTALLKLVRRNVVAQAIFTIYTNDRFGIRPERDFLLALALALGEQNEELMSFSQRMAEMQPPRPIVVVMEADRVTPKVEDDHR